MVIDTPLVGFGEVTKVKNVLDGYLPFVLFNKVTERYSSLETEERGRNVEEKIAVTLFTEDTSTVSSVTVSLPRATRRVYLVGLKITFVLQVLTIVVNEIPNNGWHLAIRPRKPVLSGRLYIEDSPAVKLCRVHLTNLVLRAMLTTVDGCNDESISVQVPAVQLAAVGQLEKTLTDLHSSTVHFIEEE